VVLHLVLLHLSHQGYAQQLLEQMVEVCTYNAVIHHHCIVFSASL
jgi:hypothetical protein